jgi:hypothetical protein
VKKQYVAVVCNPIGSQRANGSLACWVGKREAVVRLALDHAKMWKRANNTAYTVLGGYLKEGWEEAAARLIPIASPARPSGSKRGPRKSPRRRG